MGSRVGGRGVLVINGVTRISFVMRPLDVKPSCQWNRKSASLSPLPQAWTVPRNVRV